ncbi:MAG: hypothetical protein AAB502_07050, partial [Chloroflexota bacterium]
MRRHRDSPAALAGSSPVEGKENADEELAALAKAIGHPARVQILRILVRKTACVCGEIVDELPLAIESTETGRVEAILELADELVRGFLVIAHVVGGRG